VKEQCEVEWRMELMIEGCCRSGEVRQERQQRSYLCVHGVPGKSIDAGPSRQMYDMSDRCGKSAAVSIGAARCGCATKQGPI
jgi:hypothetical protein